MTKNTIKISEKIFSCLQLSLHLSEENILLYTNKNDEIWDDVAQSLFIETILMEIPLPGYYLDFHDGNYIPINCSNQLKSIYDFLKGNLALQGLTYLTQYNGYTYEGVNGLPLFMRRNFRDYQIQFNLIDKDNKKDIRENIIKKIDNLLKL